MVIQEVHPDQVESRHQLAALKAAILPTADELDVLHEVHFLPQLGGLGLGFVSLPLFTLQHGVGGLVVQGLFFGLRQPLLHTPELLSEGSGLENKHHTTDHYSL